MGRLTDEERAQRLAEMTRAADVHDAQRAERIKTHKEQEDREGECGVFVWKEGGEGCMMQMRSWVGSQIATLNDSYV